MPIWAVTPAYGALKFSWHEWSASYQAHRGEAPGTGGLTPARGRVPAWTDSERCVGKQIIFAAAAVLLRADVVLHVW